jgi:hypothetical protein
MPTQDFYVAEDNSTKEFVADVVNGQPVYDSDLNNAQWSEFQKVVNGYIDANNIKNATATKKTGANRPGKPPING